MISKLHFLKHRIKSPTAATTEKFSSVIQLSRDLTTAPCQLFLKNSVTAVRRTKRNTSKEGKVSFQVEGKYIYVDILCLRMSLVEHQL